MVKCLKSGFNFLSEYKYININIQLLGYKKIINNQCIIYLATIS